MLGGMLRRLVVALVVLVAAMFMMPRPDACPLTLKVLAAERASLAARAAQAVPQVVFVSIDPSRDTPAEIAAYLGGFDRAFVGATAPADRLAPLGAALGVTIETHRHGADDYAVTHNDTVYVIGRGAELIAVTSGPRDAATVAAGFLTIRQRYRASHRTPA